MSAESSQRRGPASTANQGTDVHHCSPDDENGFATCARALWPRKTASHLAFKANVSERAAKFWLSGEREPSFDALMVILGEMRSRRGRRRR